MFLTDKLHSGWSHKERVDRCCNWYWRELFRTSVCAHGYSNRLEYVGSLCLLFLYVLNEALS